MSTRRVLTSVLWVAAAVVWFTLAQASSTGPVAVADMVASRGGYTLLTGRPADAMHPEAADIVYLLDHHRNVVLVYGLTTRTDDTGIKLLEGSRLEVLFGRGRSLESGGSGFGSP